MVYGAKEGGGNTMTTVKDALAYYGGLYDTPIVYRTYGPDGEDLLAGYCRHVNGKLISEDGDSYSLDDIICDYCLDYDNDDNVYLIVWYESEWTR